ncbi:bacteriohopanetetrol glucosamine biosynthesis glycosyltransferase HpnI [Nitrospira sp. Kam-Ns4a]
MDLVVTLQWLCAVPIIGGSVYAVLSLVAVVRYFRGARRAIFAEPAGGWPGVTILKPVYGLEKDLRENLRSACRQDYPEFQVVFSVQRPNDPAIPLLREIQEEFGPDRVTVAVENRVVGRNGKINNLLGGLAHARHEILIISDSDVRVPPEYLKTIVAPLADPTVGYVCTFYKAVGADRWYEKLELLTFNADMVPSMVFALTTGAATFCVGASVAFRRSTLAQIGGLEALADYLVEDYELGRRIAATGKRMTVVPAIVDTTMDLKSPTDWWRHQVYWDQNTRVVQPEGFFGTVLVRSVPFAALVALLRLCDPIGLAVLAGAVAVRLATAAAMLRWGLGDREGVRCLAWLPLRDLAATGSWALAFTQRTVVWRGSTFWLTRDGRLVPQERAACDESSSPVTTSALPDR